MEERTLLYYDHFERMPRTYEGAPIDHFICQNVRTGETVTLGSCYYNEEVSEILGGKYYERIEEAEKDYDILWYLSEEKISPVADSFEEVYEEYLRLLCEGAPEEEINSAMMQLHEVELYQNRMHQDR